MCIVAPSTPGGPAMSETAPDDRAVELASHRLALAREVVNQAAQDSARARRIAADAAREASRAGVTCRADRAGAGMLTGDRAKNGRLTGYGICWQPRELAGSVVLDSLLRRRQPVKCELPGTTARNSGESHSLCLPTHPPSGGKPLALNCARKKGAHHEE